MSLYEPDDFATCDGPEYLDGHDHDCGCPHCDPVDETHPLASELTRLGWVCTARREPGSATVILAFSTRSGAAGALRYLTGHSTMGVQLDGLLMTVTPEQPTIAANDAGRWAA